MALTAYLVGLVTAFFGLRAIREIIAGFVVSVGMMFFFLIGAFPPIDGGFYNPYYGSVDIDVVGPSLNGQFDEIIEGYERSHGYEIIKQDLLGTEVVASKIIRSKTGKKIGDMEIGRAVRPSDGDRFLPTPPTGSAGVRTQGTRS